MDFDPIDPVHDGFAIHDGWRRQCCNWRPIASTRLAALGQCLAAGSAVPSAGSEGIARTLQISQPRGPEAKRRELVKRVFASLRDEMASGMRVLFVRLGLFIYMHVFLRLAQLRLELVAAASRAGGHY